MAGAGLEIPEPLKPFMLGPLGRAVQLDSLAQRGDAEAARAAYYCRLKAMKSAMSNMGSFNSADPTVSAFLESTMRKLEDEKRGLGITPASEPADREIVKKFALRIFAGAEQALQASAMTADIAIARRYMVAAGIMEVLEDFGPLEQQVQDMKLYAKVMASEITAAAKEGRKVHKPASTSASDGDISMSRGSSGGSSPAPSGGHGGDPVAAPSGFPPSFDAPSMQPPTYMTTSGPPSVLPASGLPPPAPFGVAPPSSFDSPAMIPPPYYPSSGYPGPMPPAPAAATSAASASSYYMPGSHGGLPAAASAAAASAAAAVAAASSSPAPAPGPSSISEYTPIPGICWSKEVIEATRETSTAIGLLRSDDIRGARAHIAAALRLLDAKIAALPSAGHA